MKDESLFDKEWVAKPVIYLKGIGKYCECGCGKHVLRTKKGDYNKKRYHSKACQMKAFRTRHETKPNNILLANINIKTKTITIYQKKSVRQVIQITPKYKELYEFISKIEKFRSAPIKLKEVILN